MMKVVHETASFEAMGGKQMSWVIRIIVTAVAGFTAVASAETVKIALPVASLESMPIYVASQKGLFKKHGIEVEVVTSRGGGEAMKAYLAGEVQIVATGFPEV